MNIAIPGHSAPTAGFEAPLEMLAACHGRIDRQCRTLRKLVGHLKDHGPDADARRAAVNVMKYFDTAAVAHHQDEEADLFPALLESMAGSDPVCLREIMSGLIADHRELEVRWQAVRVPLSRLANGEPAALGADLVEALVDLYERHIEREESELLPMAARLLSDESLDSVGRAMRERRGIDGASI